MTLAKVKMNRTDYLIIVLIIGLISMTVFLGLQLQLLPAAYSQNIWEESIRIIDYRGDTATIQYLNNIIELDVTEYSRCVAEKTEVSIQRYLDTGAEEDELLSGNELGIADSTSQCVTAQQQG